MRSSTNKSPISLAEIARTVGGAIEGNADIEIFDVAPIERAVSGQISFVANSKYEHHAQTTQASALVLGPNFACTRIPVLRHPNPYLTFARVVDLFYPETQQVAIGIHSTASVDQSARIDASAGIGSLVHIGADTLVGQNSQVMPSVFIDDDVIIGSNCLIYPGVRILHGSRIGNNVILHPGVVVGSDGFGFAPTETGVHKIKQVGWVEIDDEVEIGANTTIDRGALGPTRIGRGTKIDNLVQIAHNVEIGRLCLIVAQVGISGSTKLGDGVVLGGQVGLVGHIEIGDRVSVGAQSGVAKSIPGGEIWLGSPARDIHLAKRIIATTDRLPELWKRIREIENKLNKDSGE